MSEGNRSRSRLLPSLLGLLILLSGLALLAGGIKLASLGGSLYYLLAGIGLALSGLLLLLGKRAALGLYALVLFASTMGGRRGQPDRPCSPARRLSLCAMPGAAPARTDRRGGAGRAPARYPPAGLRRAVAVRRWPRARYLPLVLSARRTLRRVLFRSRQQREARSWVSDCCQSLRCPRPATATTRVTRSKARRLASLSFP